VSACVTRPSAPPAVIPVVADFLVDRCDRYLDAAPRTFSEPIAIGSLTLFVSRASAWHYYARPTLGRDRPVSAHDIASCRTEMRERGVSEAFEWMHETAPEMAAIVESLGFSAGAHPLMALTGPLPESGPAEVLAAHDPLLAAAAAVAAVAFGGEGGEGLAERDGFLESVADATAVSRERIAAGLMVTGVVRDGIHGVNGVVSSCSYNPVRDLCDFSGRTFSAAELVGLATLPSHRGRGLASRLLVELTRHALDAGADLVLLSAADDRTARLYEPLGFTRIATFGDAQFG